VLSGKPLEVNASGRKSKYSLEVCCFLKLSKNYEGSYHFLSKRMLSICGHMQRLKLCNTAFIRDIDLFNTEVLIPLCIHIIISLGYFYRCLLNHLCYWIYYVLSEVIRVNLQPRQAPSVQYLYHFQTSTFPLPLEHPRISIQSSPSPSVSHRPFPRRPSLLRCTKI